MEIGNLLAVGCFNISHFERGRCSLFLLKLSSMTDFDNNLDWVSKTGFDELTNHGVSDGGREQTGTTLFWKSGDDFVEGL